MGVDEKGNANFYMFKKKWLNRRDWKDCLVTNVCLSKRT